MDTTSAATAVSVAPVPTEVAAAPPPSTAPVQVAKPSAAPDLAPAEKPLVPASAPALPTMVPLAASASTVPPSQAPRRTGAAAPAGRPVASARTAATEQATIVIPSTPAPQGNPFVQAVHNDIAEDEASHKKR
jgi:hypothetical protein